MSKRVERELCALLDEAQGSGACLVPQSERVRAALRRRMGAGEIVSPERGIYARASWWGELKPNARALAVMRGLQELYPSWVFCGVSAALAHGIDVSWELLGRAHVVAPRRSWSVRSESVVWHALRYCEGAEERPVERSGVRVTSLWRTVFDCLRWTSFCEGMVVADFAARRCAGGTGALASYIAAYAGTCRGVNHALKTLAHADGRAESGGESIARAVMIEQGFMLPELQAWVPDPLHAGRWFRVDFVWLRADGRVIVGECDGGKKLVDPELARGRSPEQVLLDQRRREGLITAYDVSVLRFTYEEAAGVTELVRKLDLYGVPRVGSPLAPAGPMPLPDWGALLRR